MLRTDSAPPSTSRLYGGADDRPNFDAAAAADGWTRCLAWTRDHGVA